jgi:lia operon protein LiaG
MEKVKRIFILLLIITGLYIIFNQGSQMDWFRAEAKNTQALITDETDLININVSSVSTTIIPEDRDDLEAIYNGKEKLTVSKSGDTVEVGIKNNWFSWFNWSPFSKKKELKIFIPADYDKNIGIDVGSGNLNFSGPSSNKPMHLEELMVDIGSGNLHLSNLAVKDFVQDVSSGNVNIDSLKTESGSFDISSGNLDLKHYTGPIEADVSSGRLNIQMDQLTDSVNIEVSSGAVNLHLPEDADFMLNGNVSSGVISCDVPLTSKEQTKHRLKGKHGSGKYPITLDVSSGIVRIQ